MNRLRAFFSRRRKPERPTGEPVLAAAYRWHAPPPAPLPAELCLFVAMCRQSQFAEHTRRYIAALADEGFGVIVVAIVENIDDPPPAVPHGGVALLLRENGGYDFAAWATVLRLMPEILGRDAVLFANDSVFGPFDGFGEMIARLRGSTAPAVALTSSLEFRSHFQSYLFALKQPALRSNAVRAFWDDIRALSRKWDVIVTYEISLRGVLEDAGMPVEILFPLAARGNARKTNPSLCHWRELVAAGFPFMKVAALRDPDPRVDLRDWESVLRDRGADVDGIKRYLREVAPNAPALRPWRNRGLRRG